MEGMDKQNLANAVSEVGVVLSPENASNANLINSQLLRFDFLQPNSDGGYEGWTDDPAQIVAVLSAFRNWIDVNKGAQTVGTSVIFPTTDMGMGCTISITFAPQGIAEGETSLFTLYWYRTDGDNVYVTPDIGEGDWDSFAYTKEVVDSAGELHTYRPVEFRGFADGDGWEVDTTLTCLPDSAIEIGEHEWEIAVYYTLLAYAQIFVKACLGD